MAAVLGNNPFRINEWRVDPDLNRLSRGELTIKVDPQNMKVLELLASRPGEVFSSTQIEEIAWPDVVVSPNSVYQSIAHLRRALGDDKKVPRFIETISKKGYRCVGRVERIVVCQPIEESSGASTAAPRLPVRRAASKIGLGVTIAAILAAGGVAVGQYLGHQPENDSPVLGRPDVSHELPDLTAEIMMKTGDAALVAGRPYDAARHFERALASAHEATSGKDDTLAARAMAKLADAYLWQARYSEAAELAAKAVAVFEAGTQSMDPRQIVPRNVLGEALIHLDEYEAADAHLQKSIEISLNLYGPFDATTESTKSTLIKLRCAEGRLLEAEQVARELLSRPISSVHDRMGRTLHRTLLANVLYEQQRYLEAVDEARVALGDVETIGDADHPYAASAHQLLANGHLRLGHYREADVHARASYRIWKLNQFDQQRLARAASTLGEVFVHQGKLNEAREQLTYAARILQEGAGHWHRSAKRENDERIALLNAALAKNKS